MEDYIKNYFTVLVSKNEYLSRHGWINSLIQEKVINAEGQPIPWFAYPAIDLLHSRISLLPNLHIFEFGCGYGTLWWASHAANVTFIEHDKEWLQKMLPEFPKNVKPIFRHLQRDGAYCSILKKLLPEKYNIIVIDGRDRVNCCYNCLQSLEENGVIIMDNSNRCEYTPGKDFLKDAGFREIQLFGLTPMVALAENSTSFFYRNNNCLGI